MLETNPVTTMPISLCAVGCHRLLTDYLAAVLRGEPNFRVRWVSGDAADHEICAASDVFIFDARCTDVPVEEAVRYLLEKAPGARCIVLMQRLQASGALPLLQCGVKGFVEYEKVEQSLVRAIQAVYEGGSWIDPILLQRYHRLSSSQTSALPVDQDALTPREEEIVRLVRQRFSNKEISATLQLEVSTVKFHLSHIYLKLGVSSRSDLWVNTYRPLPIQGRASAK